MPKRLQPTVSITGLCTVQVKSARLNILRSLPEGTEQEVLIGKQFGAAETVMHLKMGYLIARVLDARLLISRPGSSDCFREVRLNLIATADKGIYRFRVATSTGWEQIDSTLPGGGQLNRLALSAGGVLYATNGASGGGLERSLNPTYSLGPAFLTATQGLSSGATLRNLRLSGNRLWAVDTANLSLLTYCDTLGAAPARILPETATEGAGALSNHTATNIRCEWSGLAGATSYAWQLNHDTDFSSLPTGFEGTTSATSVRLPALEPATTYYWRVRAENPVRSPWSEKCSFTTCLDTETTTLTLESPSSGEDVVSLRPVFQWSAVAGATAYELLVSAS